MFKVAPENYEGDLDFLRKAHHVLLEVVTKCVRLETKLLPQIEVINGDLVCPETSRKFPVTDGIPNMLLNEDEI